MDPLLIITPSAAEKVGQLISDEGNPNLKLRVSVTGGGCSGFQYSFSFEELVESGDILVETGVATFVIDPMSVQYMIGAQIDFEDGLEGSRFIVKNPNATSTCGCGSSFSV